jgi:uncharacterized protein (DUF305 family)
MKKHVFRPESLGPLEERLVPSAQAVQVAGLPASNASRFEVTWMREMITHHGMAVGMARLALARAGDPEVRSMARDIIRAQTREVAAMQRWLGVWYGVRDATPRPTADDRVMLGELRTLRGAEFDRMFLHHMIGHHEAAIADGTELVANARHPRLLQLGRDIIRAQSAEIARMHAMLGHAGGMDGGGPMG